MIGRFIRIASIGFAISSALFWLAVVGVIQIMNAVEEQADVSSTMKWAAQAIPTILYGLACVWFCHWFAKGVVRRIDIKAPFE